MSKHRKTNYSVNSNTCTSSNNKNKRKKRNDGSSDKNVEDFDYVFNFFNSFQRLETSIFYYCFDKFYTQLELGILKIYKYIIYSILF